MEFFIIESATTAIIEMNPKQWKYYKSWTYGETKLSMWYRQGDKNNENK